MNPKHQRLLKILPLSLLLISGLGVTTLLLLKPQIFQSGAASPNRSALPQTGVYWQDNMRKFQNREIYSSSPQSNHFTVCGLTVNEQPVGEYDPSKGEYVMRYMMKNTTDDTMTIQLRTFTCRCAEDKGNWPKKGWSQENTNLPPSPACIGYYPEGKTCVPIDETIRLSPGEESERFVLVGSSPQLPEPNCGSFQADVSVLSVNGNSSCLAHPMVWGYQYTKLTGGKSCDLKSTPKPETPPQQDTAPPASGGIEVVKTLPLTFLNQEKANCYNTAVVTCPKRERQRIKASTINPQKTCLPKTDPGWQIAANKACKV